MRRGSRKSRDTLPPLPSSRPAFEGLPRHLPSPTAVAAEAIRTGVVPLATATRRAPTPDQSAVDDIGRAYGLQEEDSGALRSAEEVLGRRDRHRDELQPPRRRP